MNTKALLLFITLSVNTVSAQSGFLISRDAITVLPAFEAELTEGLTISPHQDLDKDPKVFAVDGWKHTQQSFTWKINVPEKGAYKVAILLSVKNLSEALPVVLQVSSGNEKISLETTATDWNKMFFSGSLHLSPGMQQLQLRLAVIPGTEQPQLGIYSLEIATEENWTKNQAMAEKLRSNPAWLDNAGYGLFFHWNARSQPRTGKAKSYEDAARDFDVAAFAQRVKNTGADFIIFTTSWDLQTFPAPLKTLDQFLPGNTTTRDLIADLAAALKLHNIQLLVYCNFRMNRLGWKKEDRWVPGKNALFFDKLISIYGEIGKRYANKIGGLWIDDGMGLYAYNAPFRDITSAIKQDDKNMIVAYNSWIYPRFTDFQDLYGGEHGITLQSAGVSNPHLPVGGDGYFVSGPQQGLKATFCGLMEPGDWTHTQPDQAIPPPLLSADTLVNIVKEAKARKNLPVMNVSVYQDGRISPATEQLLQHLKKAME